MEFCKYISLTVGETSSQQAALRWEERAPLPAASPTHAPPTNLPCKEMKLQTPAVLPN